MPGYLASLYHKILSKTVEQDIELDLWELPRVIIV